jgi:hypothetical protein
MTTQASGNSGLDMGLIDMQSVPKVPTTPGLKFEMPSLPLPKDGHIKHRHDPVVEQVTNLLMEHGKKSVAERVGNPLLSCQVQESNGSRRTWPQSCNTSEHRPSPQSTLHDPCFLARHRHRISRLTPSSISLLLLTQLRLLCASAVKGVLQEVVSRFRFLFRSVRGNDDVLLYSGS